MTHVSEPGIATQSAVGRRDLRAAAVVFTLTMFIGSALLFLVQPMLAKLLLPRLGGSPAVWNTCMLFFQAVLLAGYAYAHITTRWLGVRRQSMTHLALLVAALVTLPLAVPAGDPSPDRPTSWLLLTLATSVGLPFFAVSTTAPLLQRWFAALPVRGSQDPYFLYAASNAGSLVALLAYPVVVEPLIGARQQTILWTAGYGVLLVLIVACALLVRASSTNTTEEGASRSSASLVSNGERIAWVLLSFVPSSLMLGVTSYVTSDLAAVPLLWVLPLSLYLLTFVMAFARRQVVGERQLAVATHVLVVLSLLTIFVNSHRWSLVPLHLVTFFAVALRCHQALAARRPDVTHLTAFYLWISTGGVLGGVFNSLIAPQVFSTVLEYPLLLAFSPGIVWLLASDRDGRAAHWLPGLAAGVALLIAGTLWFLSWPTEEIGLIALAVVVGTCARPALAMRSAGAPFISLVLVLLMASGWFAAPGKVLFTGRSFFGVHRLVEAADGSHRLLYHGSTIHGRQELNVGGCPVSSYYFKDGPAGQALEMMQGRRASVAVIGLGAGTLACYAEPGETWTFFEIDPMVEYLATRSGLLQQMSASPGHVSVVLGDGRLKLQESPPGTYDVVIVDVFSSDSIPVHLMTREAIALYASRLRPGGVILMNISNRYVAITPVLARIAAQEGLHLRQRFDGRISDEDARRGRTVSQWAVLAPSPSILEPLETVAGWSAPAVDPNVRAWTDDYSNLVAALKYR